MPENLWLIGLGVLIVAFLYSSVGHAGASGYIAVMTMCGLAQKDVKPAALILNILVASLGTFQFWRAGHFSWRLFWPFALASIPMAFLGGLWELPKPYFEILVGLVLLFSAARFLFRPPREGEPQPPSVPVALGVGAGLGLLAGLTGTGGGIFLTPLVIFMHWARTKTASAISAMFILVNSISGLTGYLKNNHYVPDFVAPLAVAAVVGGGLGSYLGSRRFPVPTIKILLAIVLSIAGFQLTREGIKELLQPKGGATANASPPSDHKG